MTAIGCAHPCSASMWQHSLTIRCYSRYDRTRENALEVVRAIPVAYERVEEVVKNVSDVMESLFTRLVVLAHGRVARAVHEIHSIHCWSNCN